MQMKTIRHTLGGICTLKKNTVKHMNGKLPRSEGHTIFSHYNYPFTRLIILLKTMAIETDFAVSLTSLYAGLL